MQGCEGEAIAACSCRGRQDANTRDGRAARCSVHCGAVRLPRPRHWFCEAACLVHRVDGARLARVGTPATTTKRGYSACVLGLTHTFPCMHGGNTQVSRAGARRHPCHLSASSVAVLGSVRVLQMWCVRHLCMGVPKRVARSPEPPSAGNDEFAALGVLEHLVTLQACWYVRAECHWCCAARCATLISLGDP